MDYKAKYEEALKRADAAINIAADKDLVKGVATTIFPELAEDEDERIREWLVDYFNSIKSGVWRHHRYTITCEQILAWLEKQKEQKPEYASASTIMIPSCWAEKQKENPKNAISIPADCASNAKCPYKINGDEDFIGDIKNTPAYHFGFDEGVRSEREKQKPIDYDHEMWKNCEVNFEGGKKEVIDHPEKYGLQKEQKPVEPSDDELQRHPPITYTYPSDASRDEQLKMALLALLNSDLIKVAGNKFTKQDFIDWVERQQEQKPAEWSEDWREEDIQTRFAFYTYKDDSSELYLSNVFVEETSRNHGFGTRILIAAEKVAETIGATTICLKVKQDSPANAWYRKRGYGYVAFEDGYDWLEKNLEYMKPVKSAEWSEEDEKMLEEIINHIYTTSIQRIPARPGSDIGKSWIKFLKSLRPSWKPSEEQMKALSETIEFMPDTFKPKCTLVTLQDDLEKQM